MKITAMIPARLGSQRLKQKNLQLINGIPLITHAIKKTKASSIFDEIWVNSEAEIFREIANIENVQFHKRPDELANNTATSEDFIYEFLKIHQCDYVVQVHSIAPLLNAKNIVSFVNKLRENKPDVLLSVESMQIECICNSKPINFNYHEKTNSQEIDPVQRITWSITAWNRNRYIQAYEEGKCATYAGNIEYFSINKLASHIIKTKEDLNIANVLYSVIEESKED